MGGSSVQGSLRDIAPAGLKLIETMRWEPGCGVLRRDLHLARLARGCQALGISQPDAGAVLDRITGEVALRLRLTVGLSGEVELSQAKLGPAATLWHVKIARERLASNAPWLRIKTTERSLYDRVRETLPAGIDEVIFLNERDELCEGTITNLFLQRDDGVLLTPPVSSGCLPGVLRRALLDDGRAQEAVLRPDDLIGRRFYMGNSLRALIAAEIAAAS